MKLSFDAEFTEV